MSSPNFESGTTSYPVEYILLDDGSWLLKNFIPLQLGPTFTHTSTLLPFIKGFKKSDEAHPNDVPKLLERAVAKMTIGFRLNKDYMDKLRSMAADGEKEYEIWSEGFLVTGMEGVPAKAELRGKAYGKDFADAANNLAKANYLFGDYYDAKKMTWYGCRLFENEEDARIKFG